MEVKNQKNLKNMVNEKLRIQRKTRIAEITKILNKLYSSGKIITNRKDFIMDICVKFDVQQRKASEYLKVAEYMLKHHK